MAVIGESVEIATPLSRSNSAGRAALYLLLAAGLAIAVWAARRGFDFIDGGCYYLEYTDPADVVDLHTSFHLVGRLVFLALGRDIVLFRLASVLLVLAAAGVLGAGVVHHLRRLCRPGATAGLTSAATVPVWLMGGLVVFAVSPAALTYNSLNAAAVFASAGLLLFALGDLQSAESRGRRRGWLELGGACLVAAFDLFIKPPTSLMLGGAIFGLCALTPLLSRGTKLRMAGAGLGGLVAAVLVAPVFLGGWSGFAERLGYLASYFHQSAYEQALLRRAGDDAWALARMVGRDVRWPLAAGAVATLLGAAWRQWRPISAAMAAAMGTIWFAAWLAMAWRIPAWRAAQRYYAEGAVTRFNLDTMILLAAAVLAGRLLGRKLEFFRDRRAAAHGALVLALLVLLPFAGAFGTTNLLYLNAAFHVPCWMGVILVLILAVRSQWQAPIPIAWAWLPIVGFGLAQYVNGAVINPYALKTDLFHQNVPTPVGSPASTLLLDPDNSRFIADVRGILDAHGFKPGDDIFAFFNMPGLVYAVGGRSPVIPWYFGRIYVGDGIESSYMQQAGADRRQRAFIITQDDLTRFRDHFHQGGIDFPEGYELLGSLTNPNTALPVKIWKPRDR